MNWQERIQEGLALFDVRLFEIGGTPVTAATLATMVLILVFAFLVSRLIQRAVTGLASRRRVADEGTIGVSTRLLHYTIMLIGLAIALNTVGIRLTALFAAGALFAVAIGFALQSITANFVSGLILLFERSVKPGDVIESDGKMVRVKHMGIRSTIAGTLNDEDVVIPNSLLVQNTVKNFTFRDRAVRIRITVGVLYSSDMRLVRDTLEATLLELPWRSRTHEPIVFMKEFGHSSVNFELSVWIDDPWKMQRYNSRLHEAVWFAFRQAGITIAFPQLDVHFDPPVVESLQSFSKAS